MGGFSATSSHRLNVCSWMPAFNTPRICPSEAGALAAKTGDESPIIKGRLCAVDAYASEKPVTVRGLAYVMAGHVRHHLASLRDRYAIP